VKIFISSVVRGYEHYRATARKAVELLQHTPGISEYFPAQPQSSEAACMAEVKASDVVVLILGAEYGYETPSGRSVTQQEYHHARALNKPVLAFLENVEATGKQKAFRQQVSDYTNGLFRESFSTEAELYDGIIKALHLLKQQQSTPDEQEFVDRLKSREKEGGGFSGGLQGATMEFTFSPHPAPRGALREHDKQRNTLYVEMCEAGLCDLAAGFSPYDTAATIGLDAPLRNPTLRWRKQDDGLEWIRLGVQPRQNASPMAFMFVSPERVRVAAQTGYKLIGKGQPGWYQIALEGIGNCHFAEPPPVHVTTGSSPLSNVNEVHAREFLMPASEKALATWLEEALYAFERKISYR
jgi:nucleoside 2-deoxyribosyltransferase